jgi:hypothetical protein
VHSCPRKAATLHVMPTLYVMRDVAGCWPVCWREPKPPKKELGRSWEYLGEVEEAEIAGALEALHRRWEKREL